MRRLGCVLSLLVLFVADQLLVSADQDRFSVEFPNTDDPISFGCQQYTLRIRQAFFAQRFVKMSGDDGEPQCVAPVKPCIGESLTEALKGRCECSKSCTLQPDFFAPNRTGKCPGDPVNMRLVVFYQCDVDQTCRNHQEYLDREAGIWPTTTAVPCTESTTNDLVGDGSHGSSLVCDGNYGSGCGCYGGMCYKLFPAIPSRPGQPFCWTQQLDVAKPQPKFASCTSHSQCSVQMTCANGTEYRGKAASKPTTTVTTVQVEIGNRESDATGTATTFGQSRHLAQSSVTASVRPPKGV
ncbi:hypothetical protein BV898_17895 [Hypsibius exemplaris]|uniref:SUEL-type lectin domain-containing protein n=1 Tax=Hypsibius exemplaris TaxID=2072580 RepID=A0A9X6RMZ2_HYPEX|nr:hypothetical protein BV898_17895 [Hypsibius exemplaris]